MSNFILTTAGHIDHGKSTLIKKLTGKEMDSHKEEKARGLTIDLGFAYLPLPSGKQVGIVDVPGHEKFIKNMVAGLAGIDLVLLVIDSNEGIMPQTKEHIDILTLLGIENYIIVMTKVKSSGKDMYDLVVDDIKEQFKGTVLENAPIVSTDALSGYGIDNLIKEIDLSIDKIEKKEKNGKARLNIDRVFSVKGFGTVVTGTLLDGSLKNGDELLLYPSQKRTKVRNIQVHESNVEEAFPGQRTAINLANMEKDDLIRGDVLYAGEDLSPSWMLDVRADILKNLENEINLWDRLRVLIGTREVMARAVPIGSEKIEKGSSGFLQLRLEDQLAVKKGDRFILRTYSPMVTIAGGEILDANPQKHRRYKDDVIETLIAKNEDDHESILEDFLITGKKYILSIKDIEKELALESEEVKKLIESIDEIINIGNFYAHKTRFESLIHESEENLENYHEKNPLKKGMPYEEFISKGAKSFGIDNSIMSSATKRMIDKNIIKEESGTISLKEFLPVIDDSIKKLKDIIMKEFETKGYELVKKSDLIQKDKKIKEVLELISSDEIVFLDQDNMISAKKFIELEEMIIDYINKNGKLTLAEFRDMTDTSRKISLAILDKMDSIGITKRVEDYRVLAK